MFLQKKFKQRVHKLIEYQKPNGWDNQIATDIISSWNIVRKKAFLPSPNFEILGEVQANAGTLSNNFGLGTNLGYGLCYFSNYERLTLWK
jgi:hypothetical protein